MTEDQSRTANLAEEALTFAARHVRDAYLALMALAVPGSDLTPDERAAVGQAFAGVLLAAQSLRKADRRLRPVYQAAALVLEHAEPAPF